MPLAEGIIMRAASRDQQPGAMRQSSDRQSHLNPNELHSSAMTTGRNTR